MEESVLKQLFTKEELHKIKTSKILLVGCGGIGCELIKNIIKLGFLDLFLIDNDYVDISNLNRQFYFTKQMINKSKSFVIRDMLNKEYPHIQVAAEYLDIQSKTFLSSFYRQFSLVLCALDNRDAKEHLSYMCIKYNLPMIIVGAEGFNGQSKVVIRGKYECIFCDENFLNKNEEPENISVCNLKGVPNTSNDCIIWAKYFLEDLFFVKKYVMAQRKGLTNKKNIEEYWQSFFDETFHYEESPKIKDHKKIENLTFQQALTKIEPLENEEKNSKLLSPYEKLQSLSDYAQKFIQTLEYLFEFQENPGNFKFIATDYKKLSLYSGDDNFIDFLTACTNLRIYIYKNSQPKLEYQHEYQVKNVVGKIVPSIASTNSIIGAIQIAETIKILFSDNISSYEANIKWVSQDDENLIKPTSSVKCNFDCRICSMKILYFGFYMDFSQHCLNDLITELKKCKDFDIGKISYDRFIVYDSEDVVDKNCKSEAEKNLTKKIRELMDIWFLPENLEELHLRISNDNKKINFEWDLVLINKKIETVCAEDTRIKEKVKKQLYDYYMQKEIKAHADKFKNLKKCLLN